MSMITNSQIYRGFLVIVADRVENNEPLNAKTVNRYAHSLLLNFGTNHKRKIKKSILRAIRGVDISV